MKIYTCEQGTEEWHKLRLGKFTASEAQAIATAGKGLETLVYEKAAEILTGKPKESYTNKDMERGHELESVARNLYELETGNVVRTVGFCELHEFIGASPDGLIGDKKGIEIKNPTDPVYARYLFDKKIDPKYYAQMQMQIMVCDLLSVDYVVHNPNFKTDIVTVNVPRDEAFIVKLRMGLVSGVQKLKEILEKVR